MNALREPWSDPTPNTPISLESASRTAVRECKSPIATTASGSEHRVSRGGPASLRNHFCPSCGTRLCRLVEAPVIQPGKGMQLLKKAA